jgi:hypothetical protein
VGREVEILVLERASTEGVRRVRDGNRSVLVADRMLRLIVDIVSYRDVEWREYRFRSSSIEQKESIAMAVKGDGEK